MDHICDSFNSVGAGIDNRLHDGWRHSCPAGYCHRCGDNPGYSGPKTSVTIIDSEQATHERRYTMPLIQLVIVLVVVGVVLWLINSYIPMQSTIKKILNVVVVIGVILWLLSAFGVIGNLSSIRIGN